jgi:hypothetical protein
MKESFKYNKPLIRVLKYQIIISINWKGGLETLFFILKTSKAFGNSKRRKKGE